MKRQQVRGYRLRPGDRLVPDEGPPVAILSARQISDHHVALRMASGQTITVRPGDRYTVERS